MQLSAPPSSLFCFNQLKNGFAFFCFGWLSLSLSLALAQRFFLSRSLSLSLSLAQRYFLSRSLSLSLPLSFSAPKIQKKEYNDRSSTGSTRGNERKRKQRGKKKPYASQSLPPRNQDFEILSTTCAEEESPASPSPPNSPRPLSLIAATKASRAGGTPWRAGKATSSSISPVERCDPGGGGLIRAAPTTPPRR